MDNKQHMTNEEAMFIKMLLEDGIQSLNKPEDKFVNELLTQSIIFAIENGLTFDPKVIAGITLRGDTAYQNTVNTDISDSDISDFFPVISAMTKCIHAILDDDMKLLSDIFQGLYESDSTLIALAALHPILDHPDIKLSFGMSILIGGGCRLFSGEMDVVYKDSQREAINLLEGKIDLGI